MKFTNEFGHAIDISVIGFFSIPELEKEYIMYGLIDDNNDNELGGVMLGEVVKEEDGNIQILGILSEEKDLVVAYYNEISKQVGSEDNE